MKRGYFRDSKEEVSGRGSLCSSSKQVLIRKELQEKADVGFLATPSQVKIFTDGACNPNPGPGGWAAIIFKDGEKKEICGGDKLTTNNRMELFAVISALRTLPDGCDVVITTDSRYIVDSFEKGWIKKWEKQNWMRNKKDAVISPDLWKELLALSRKHKVKFVWVKGHAGHKHNERCDLLATREAARYAKM